MTKDKSPNKNQIKAVAESPIRPRRSRPTTMTTLEIVRVTPDNDITYHTTQLDARIASIENLKQIISQSLAKLSKHHQLFINGQQVLHLLPTEAFEQVVVIEEDKLRRRKNFQKTSSLQQVIASGFFDLSTSKPMEGIDDVIALENQGLLEIEFIEEYPEIVEDLVNFVFKRN